MKDIKRLCFRHLSYVHMTNIRSFSHKLYTKTDLSPFDDKRYVLDDNFSILAYGHFKNEITIPVILQKHY